MEKIESGGESKLKGGANYYAPHGLLIGHIIKNYITRKKTMETA